METTQSNPVESPEDKKKTKRALRAIGAAVVATALGVGAYLGLSSNEKQAPPTTTGIEAPTTTSTTELTHDPGVQPEDGQSGGVVVEPGNPDVTVPAESQTTEAGVTSEQVPTAVVVTPENPDQVEVPKG
jgi:hypothetical protein